MKMNRLLLPGTVIALASLLFVDPLAALDPDSRHQLGATVVRGTVTSVHPPFTVVLEDGLVIEVGLDTEWSGLAGARDLAPGDEVVVVGERALGTVSGTVKAGGIRVASRRGRLVPDGSPVCSARWLGKQQWVPSSSSAAADSTGPTRPVWTKAKDEIDVEGNVITIAADRFSLRADSTDEYEVLVTDETEFDSIGSLAELQIDDRVRVRGEVDGSTINAERVELRSDDDESDGDDSSGEGDDDGDGDDDGGEDDDDVDFKSIGAVQGLLPPDRFSFDDGRLYRVDGLTVYDEPIVSYAGLEVGMYLEIEAVYEGGSSYRAVKIEYEGDYDDGQRYEEVEGTVASVAASTLGLTDGTVVLMNELTVFNGDADRAEEIVAGWWVEIYALHNATGDLLARTVRAESSAVPSTSGEDFEPHDAILVLADGVDASAVAARHGAELVGEVSAMGVLFRFHEDIDDELLAEVSTDPDVVAVEPNFQFRDPESTRRRFVVVDRSPTAEKYRNQTAAARHGLAKALAIADGAGAVVAVMDSGVDHCHPLLEGHLVGGGLDLIDGDISPWATANGLDDDGDGDIDEASGHGTFVASLIALAAPGASILPYRVLDDDGGGTAFDLALALADAIDRDVDVINLSLAYRTRSMVVDLLIEEASRRGIVVIAAAGNDGSAVLPFPATDSHVIAVTALRADGTGLADFANRNDRILAAATGEDLYGALEDGGYGTWSGTSMAAPFAAAGAALVKTLDPEVSPEIIRQLLSQTGLQIVDGNWTGSSIDLGKALAVAQP